MRGTQTECCAVVVRHTAFRLFPPYPPPAPFTSPSPPCAAVPVPHRLCVVGSSLGWAHQRERSPQIAPALVPRGKAGPRSGGGGAGMAASGSDKVFSGGARPPCPSRPALRLRPAPRPPPRLRRRGPAAQPAATPLHGGRQGRAGGGGGRAAHGPEAGPGQPPVRRTAALNPVGDFLSCLGARRGGDRAGAPGAPAGRGTRLRTGARPCTGGGRGYLGALGLRSCSSRPPISSGMGADVAHLGGAVGP